MDFMAVMDDLRAAVDRDPRSRADIARAAGIHPKTFIPIMKGERGLSIDGIERLADVLGLTLALVPKPAKPPRRPARPK